MSKSHNFEICRGIYAHVRAEGSPVVNVIDLGGGFMCAETADGKLLNEDVSGCCKWSIKADTAREWLDDN